jgi:TonB-linked SusC/RagA family outer membrane protein
MYLKNFIKKKLSCLVVKRSVIMLLALLTINLCGLSANAQQFRVTGTTTDDSGEVLAGVTIAVKGTNTGVVSDADGKYAITVPGKDAVLIFSYVGYDQQEIVVGSLTVVNVQLKSTTELGEVVVTALGITRDTKALGYAVSTISAKELTKVGSPNFGTALYGKASGVRIVSPPGGAASGVSFTVRGLSSINGNTQPLIVLNGVPIRSGNDEGGSSTGQFASFRSEGRIRSNGMVDLNPEDIETISILKGAAATALYGSEGANGVVVITSKRTRERGTTINVNVTLEANTLAYLPKVQQEYGPGLYTVSRSDTYELQNNGFRSYTYNGTEYEIPYYATNVSFGPRYDGRPVLYWDGKTRPYLPQTDNPWKELFRTGFDQIYNFALNHGGERSSTRFSYTYLNEVPNGVTGSFNRHNFNLIGTAKFNDRFWIDYSGNFIVQKIHNRAQRSTGAYDSFSNLFGSFVDIPLMKKMFQTSLGYRNRVTGSATLTPDESFALGLGPAGWVQSYFWGAYKNNDYETSNRFISSVAPSWRFTDYLTARTRISSDLTADKIEYKYATEYPLVLENPSGRYEAVQKQYSIIYGDAMLVFDKKIGEKFNLTVSAGWQARQENMMLMDVRTEGGLTVENMFLLNVSRNQRSSEQSRMELLKTAALATIDLSYGDFLFLGLTGRQEKSSTLPKGSRSYFYPSANLSFLYSDAFRDAMPSWYDYGKLRFSYGIVGNAPDAYAANIVYDAGSQGNFQWSTIPGTLGNEKLRPEKITEYEVGIENKLFKNRLGFEVSYYHRRVADMLIPQPLPVSDGVGNMNVNIGEMTNKGLEVSINATPVETKDWLWDLRTNFAFNANEVTYLTEGNAYLRGGGNMGNHGGGVNIRSYVGRPMGDIYVNKISRVEDPNSPYYGEKIVLVPGYGETDGWGYYLTSTGEAAQERVGNINPKLVGGLGTSLSYKRLTLDIMTDFRIGGHVMNNADFYPSCRGLTERTLQYRDAEHGGMTYTTGTGANQRTWDNGWIVPGVYFDPAKNAYVPNDIVTAVDSYWYVTYNWGNSDPGTTYEVAIMENSYWKVREVSLGYDIPVKFSKNAIKNLTVSVFGRNLFYLYKTLDDIDPESVNGGTTWGGQAGVGYSSSPTRTFGLSIRANF